MTEFGLKRRFPEESLHLDTDLSIDPEVIGVLTNFQIDAIRFLWSHLKDNKKPRRCIYNDGRHMGKRITLVALLTTLIRCRPGEKIVIACDKEEAIISWIFKLKLFGAPPEYTVYSPADIRRRAPDTTIQCTSPITLLNFTRHDVNLNKIILQNEFTHLVLDVGSAKSRDLRLGLELPQKCFLTVIYSPDLKEKQNNNILQGLLRFTPKQSSWPTLRRTNEEYLREFPWLDQKRFLVKFDEWKGHRSTQDIMCNKEEERKREKTPSPAPVEIVDEVDIEEEVVNNFPEPCEESQVMSQLLFETDDDETPIKRQPESSRRINPSQSNHLLSSMYLRISQSFANNTTTPKQRILAATVIQDSPDLFASMMDDDEEEEEDEDPVLQDFAEEEEQQLTTENTTNPFDKSTPIEQSQREIEMPSQSPIRSLPRLEFTKEELSQDEYRLDSQREIEMPSQSPIRSLPRPEFTKEQLLLDDHTLLGNRSDVFEITSNEVFASKIKVRMNHEAVDDDEDKLKFDEKDETLRNDALNRTPTTSRAGSAASTPKTPSSTGWLSKRGPPLKKTPEKILSKKKKSLLQFFASGSGSTGENSFGNNMDFACLDEEQTQRWNAC